MAELLPAIAVIASSILAALVCTLLVRRKVRRDMVLGAWSDCADEVDDVVRKIYEDRERR